MQTKDLIIRISPKYLAKLTAAAREHVGAKLKARRDSGEWIEGQQLIPSLPSLLADMEYPAFAKGDFITGGLSI